METNSTITDEEMKKYFLLKETLTKLIRKEGSKFKKICSTRIRFLF